MIWKFGAYKDWRLADIPTAYLSWVVRQGWLWDDARRAVAAELDERAAALVFQTHLARQQDRQRRAQATAVGSGAAWAGAREGTA
jgi:hypothetical protein